MKRAGGKLTDTSKVKKAAATVFRIVFVSPEEMQNTAYLDVEEEAPPSWYKSNYTLGYVEIPKHLATAPVTLLLYEDWRTDTGREAIEAARIGGLQYQIYYYRKHAADEEEMVRKFVKLSGKVYR